MPDSAQRLTWAYTTYVLYVYTYILIAVNYAEIFTINLVDYLCFVPRHHSRLRETSW